METSAVENLVAVDIGNSRIKIGQFHGQQLIAVHDARRPNTAPILSEPVRTFDLPITSAAGDVGAERLRAWCDQHVREQAEWLIASVHRGAAKLFHKTVQGFASHRQTRQLTYRDVPLSIQVDEPARVGIDRLLAALAVNRLRRPERAAIVVDLGTAITVDLVTADGAFAGGAILPGIAMSARALAEQTDALPYVALDQLEQPPTPLGKSTVPAIQAGLYWGALGAIRELAHGLSADLPAPPDMFLTGGASPCFAELLRTISDLSVRHVPHLVLAGIALAGAAAREKAED